MPVDGSTCGAVLQHYPLLPSPHVAECSLVEYSSNPPTSGPHYGFWAEFGIYDQAIPRGFWVHAMEHGAVVVAYSCTDCGSAVDAVVDADLRARGESGAPVSVIFMDLDFFKSVNDRHGHAIGSRVIAEAGRLLRARESRSAAGVNGRSSGGSLLWRAKIAGHMVGQLLLRSFERSDRVYNAMVARGYNGRLLTMNPHHMKSSDWRLGGLGVAAILLIQLVARL